MLDGFKLLFFKRIIFVLLFIFSFVNCFALSISDLTKLALESNVEIKSALSAYKTQRLSSKYLNGAYVPLITLNSAGKVPKGYEWKNLPNYFDSSIVYTQPLPGGTSVSIEPDYSFNTITVNTDTYLTQSFNIAFSLSQSLLPFWVQGKILDPLIRSSKQNEDYYYYQLLCTKKDVIIQLIQNYVYALVSLNESAIYKNSIDFYDEQIESLKEFEERGNISRAKILEIEDLKWTALKNLMSSQMNFTMYIQILKTICGQDFDEKQIIEYIESKKIDEKKEEIKLSNF